MNNSFQRQRIDTAKLPPQVVQKWSASILNEGFVPFPKRLVRCMHRIFTDGNSSNELAVVLAIVDYKRPNLTRPPSLDYLAFLADLKPDEFQTALTRLETKGYVRVSGGPEAMDVSITGLMELIERETK